MPRLSVNIDHVATIREARKTFEPEPVTAAMLAELGGADGIICHLREDRRHIQDRDLVLLRKVLSSKLNLEMAAASEIVRIALKTRPEQVTLVPEKRAEITTEGGLDVVRGGKRLADSVKRLKRKGIIVSLFVDPEPRQLQASAAIGADAVELHTGPYANAGTEKAVAKELRTLVKAADEVARLGLTLNAGHGLTYTNLRGLVEAVEVNELHIGHSIVARAVMAGMERAVREMCDLIARHCRKT